MVAAVGIPAAFCLVYLGGWTLGATLALLGAFGALEVYRLAGLGGVRALSLVGVIGAAAMPLAAVASRPGGLLDGSLAALLGAAWLITIMLLALRARTPQD